MDYRLLIERLEKGDLPNTTSEIADFLGFSETKVKQTIKNLNDILSKNGARIEGKTGKGNGYRLIVEDEAKYSSYRDKLNSESSNFADLNKENRVFYLIQRLIQEKDYIKIEDLADEIYVSKSLISKDLPSIKKVLAEFDLQIVSKPYYGIKIMGEEISARKCIALLQERKNKELNYMSSAFSKDNSELNRKIIVLKSLIISECKEFGYDLSDFVCQNLATHLYVSIMRAEDEFSPDINEEAKASIENMPEFKLAESIISSVNSTMNVSLQEEEIYYCTIHLCGKKKVSDYNLIEEETKKLVDEMLITVRDIYNVDLRHNLKLIAQLALHIKPLISRIQFNIELKNPLEKEIKSRYILAYDIAVTCAELLGKKYNCKLKDSEICYFALYFEQALIETEKGERKNVLVVCSTGRGSAELLRSSILENHRKYIKEVVTCDVLSVNEVDLDNFDLILSTVPFECSKKVYLINQFLTEKDNDVIRESFEESKINESFLRFFNEELYFYNLQADSKEEVIHEMVERIKKHRTVPSDFEAMVLEREKYSNTSFADGVGFPHPIRMLDDETFISIGILPKPIEWDFNSNVKMVILSNFEKKFAVKNNDFYVILGKLLSDKKTVNELSKTKTFEEWKRIILTNLGGQ